MGPATILSTGILSVSSLLPGLGGSVAYIGEATSLSPTTTGGCVHPPAIYNTIPDYFFPDIFNTLFTPPTLHSREPELG